MPRYKLDIAYDGRDWHGFQSQKNTPDTIEGKIEEALYTYLRHPIDIIGSSRTDKGVHARNNTAHFDIDRALDAKDLYHLNAILPESIVLTSLIAVSEEFHARFDATSRCYDYYIDTCKSPLSRLYSYYFPYKIDSEVLPQIAAMLFEYEDFSSFSKKNTDVFHYKCKIIASEWTIDGDALRYHVRANRFLRGMVRGLVASQLAVARGKMSQDRFVQLLESPSISAANFSAPPHGLFLTEVSY